MANTVTLRGQTYPVEPFTMIHMSVVAQVMRQQANGQYGMAGLKEQTEAAEMIKLVICPDIPDDWIYLNRSGRYVFLLEPDEVSILSLQFIKICYQKELEKAEKSKDTERVAILKQQVSHYGDLIAEGANLIQGDNQPEPEKTPGNFSDLLTAPTAACEVTAS